MKILLVNPPRLDAGSVAKKIHPPLNLLYLATALKEQGIDVAVMDSCALDIDAQGILNRIAQSDADIIGYPLFSDIHEPMYGLVKGTKQRFPDKKIVLGGIHVTADPEGTAKIFKDADFFLSSYAEKSLPMLVRAIETGHGLEDVPLLTRRQKGRIVTNPNDDVIDVNAISFPDRSFVQSHYDNKDYYQLFNTLPFDSIVTGRGCPHQCKFCYNAIRKGTMFRSAENIYDEILLLHKRGVRYLDVDDDNFTLVRERAMKLFSRLEKDKLGLRLFIKSRTDSIDKEMLESARRAGVVMISYGVESGAQKILDAMGKRTKVERNAEVIAMTKAAGLKVHLGFLIGYPGDTPETIQQTISFVRSVYPDAASVQILKPYIGTEVYEQAKAEGTLEGSWDPREPGIPWVRLPWTRSIEDLEKWKRIFNQRVYLRAKYAIRIPADILANANMRMAKYAFQSFLSLLGFRE